jgi:uncharacterized protein GlcG (DUF336 family)
MQTTRKIVAGTALASLVAWGPLASAEEAMTLPIKRLSMETAMKIAKTAIDRCRKEGVNIAVTVVDRGGHPQVVLRDTLAMDLTLPISQKKAYTAMSFNSATSALENRFPGSYSVGKLDSVVIAAGGLPINAGGQIMGGVGVSGAPSGTTDEMCAKAGLDAIMSDLEMSM